MNQEKQSNVELLRIIAMLFVIAYHIISQSNALDVVNSDNFVFCVVFHAGGRMACNIFVMIGAFFLVDLPFRVERITQLYIKTLFACLLVNGFILLTFPHITNTSLYFLQFFPIAGKPYWFIQNYIFLLVLSPFLNQILHNNKNNAYIKGLLFGALVIVALGSIPLLSTYIPFSNDLVWFVFLYCLMGYLKQHPIRILASKYTCLLIALMMYSVMCVSVLIFDHLKTMWLHAWEIRFFFVSTYQSFFSFICALCLFYFFVNIRIPTSKIINVIARHSFGIFILHQVPILYWDGWVWKYFFKIDVQFNTPQFIPYCFFVMFAVVIMGMLIDKILNLFVIKIVGIRPVKCFCAFVNRNVEGMNNGTCE
ncbi:acyltransferase [Agathobaculum sp. NTUH-O15-33]|uniref:acyltransferase n=1 Tax=Agathobaculum sp. NTUH-O15-33 TaxID=3079302 RepID=UPI002958CB19|nr:acyltransferase [Agathobaculum sp. NTUH-O15-33]WNX85164.1 acyltransferase [Agathobaculum sp. NTUH-O15-33]